MRCYQLPGSISYSGIYILILRGALEQEGSGRGEGGGCIYITFLALLYVVVSALYVCTLGALGDIYVVVRWGGASRIYARRPPREFGHWGCRVGGQAKRSVT